MNNYTNEVIVWSPGVTLELIEKQVILKAFDFFQRNKTTTANALGIDKKTLDVKLAKYETEELVWKAKEEHAKTARDLFLARQRGPARDAEGCVIYPQEAEVQKAKQVHTASGVRVESAAQASEKPTVPVSKRTEVQSVLSNHSAPGGSKKAR